MISGSNCRHNIATENNSTLYTTLFQKMKKSVLVFGFLLVNTAAFVSCNQEDQNPNPVSAAQRNTFPLSGRIVNEKGEGLAGASVSAADRSVISGPDGVFRLDVPADSEKLLFVASAAGYQDGSIEICSDQNHEEGIKIRLATKTDCNSPALCKLNVNGDGFRNKTIELGNIPSSSVGIFSADGNSTYFSMSSKSGYSVAGVFPGHLAGISSTRSSMTLIAYGKTYVADSGVEISVKEYGEVGKKIKGSFSGTFKRYDVDLKTGRHLEYSIQVRDGNFEVIRQSDI